MVKMQKILFYIKRGVELFVNAASVIIREFFTGMGRVNDIDYTIKLFKKRVHGTVRKEGASFAIQQARNRLEKVTSAIGEFFSSKKRKRSYPPIDLTLISKIFQQEERVIDLTDDMITQRC